MSAESRGSSRDRVRRAAMEWEVGPAEVGAQGLDERLRVGVGRTGLLQVLIDHDTTGMRRCPRCGWATTSLRRNCPSRTVAHALLEHKPLPGWLDHLAEHVPGARTRPTASDADERRAAEDDLPGLFPAPRRMPPGGDHT